MTAKVAKVAAVIVGGPIFAVGALWLGCSSSPPILGPACNAHLMFGFVAWLTLAFWFCVPTCVLLIRALRGKG